MQINTITDYSKTNGTSWYSDTIITTAIELIKAFGEVDRGHYDDKSQFDWSLELSDGTPFTIYDWKEYRKFGTNERIKFHIGGFDNHSTGKARKAILDILIEITNDNELDVLTQAN